MPQNNPTPRGVVVLADDEWLVRWSLERALKRHGFTVLSAASGSEAIDLMTGHAVDWLIADYKMPDIDGLELLRRANHDHPEIHLVLMTAFGSSQVESRANKIGAKYFSKPFDVDSLVNTILSASAPI